MGRPRTKPSRLPERYKEQHGAYYYWQPQPDKRNPKWVRVGKTEADVYRHRLRRLEDYGADGSTPKNVGQLLDMYLALVAPQKAERTYQSNLQEARFLRLAFGDVDLDDLTARHWHDYSLNRRAQSHPAHTAPPGPPRLAKRRAQLELALLSHAMSYAVQEHWAKANPFLGISKRRIGDPKSQARVDADARLPGRAVTALDYIIFAAHASPVALAALEISALTGLRQCDVLGLRCDDVFDKDDGGLRCIISKTARHDKERDALRVFYHWTPGLRCVVATLRGLRRGNEWLLTTRRGERFTSNGFSRIWNNAMLAAVAAGATRFRFHDLRRTFGLMVTQKSGLELAQYALGHSDAAVTAGYTKVGTRYLTAESCVLDALKNIRHY